VSGVHPERIADRFWRGDDRPEACIEGDNNQILVPGFRRQRQSLETPAGVFYIPLEGPMDTSWDIPLVVMVVVAGLLILVGWACYLWVELAGRGRGSYGERRPRGNLGYGPSYYLHDGD
jgi:hypothetical protein